MVRRQKCGGILEEECRRLNGRKHKTKGEIAREKGNIMKDIKDADFKEFPEQKEFIIITNKRRYYANTLDDVMWLWHNNVTANEDVLSVTTVG